MRCSRNLPLVLMLVSAFVEAAPAKKEDKVKEARETKEDIAKKEFLKKKAALLEEKKNPLKSEAPQVPAPPPSDGAAAPKPLPKLSLPLVQGQTSKGITIPYSDGSGQKTMSFRIGAATPVDADHIQMKDLTIETLNEVGEKEMTIELPGSMLDLNTRIITGNERVTIKRSDFEITGETMEFNTETKVGHMDGNIRMIIYDLSEETGDTGSKTEAPNK